MTPIPAPRRLRLGTRGSGLAVVQTETVASMLLAVEPALQLDRSVVRTRGDVDRHSALTEIGGMGVFTAELEHALIAGDIDVAIHSLKDLPLEPSAGVLTGAVCARDDTRDVLVSHDGSTLAALPAGRVVGTSSARRAAQLRAARPDLAVRPIRGNVDTRIDKVLAGEFDAVILAAAGLIRLGLTDRIAEFLPLDTFVPAPGQAALAVQCRQEDFAVRSVLARLDDPVARATTDAERAFLAGLGGGCSLPVAAIGRITGRRLYLNGWVGAADGTRRIVVSGDCEAAPAAARTLGLRLADEAAAAGAGVLLA